MNNHLLANPALANTNGWQQRHNAAVSAPHAGFERALVTMLCGWLEYASACQARYESPIGSDYVLGPEWKAIGEGIRGLLNGESGSRLDMGTLDACINRTLTANGIEEE
jgi:hypothetical protein